VKKVGQVADGGDILHKRLFQPRALARLVLLSASFLPRRFAEISTELAQTLLQRRNIIDFTDSYLVAAVGLEPTTYGL
jgi:hypothetical protein